jgi:hypothetical protein
VPAAVARLHLQPVGNLPSSQRLNLVIGLPLRNSQALDQFLEQLYDPASTIFHQYLTPEQFTERFGPTEEDYQAVIAFAQRNHLTITATSANRLVLNVSGSVADIQQAFHVTMRSYRHPTENREFYAPDVEPTVDPALPVADVSGLNNYELPHPKNLLVRPLNKTGNVSPKSGSGPSGTYMGNDFRAAYAPGVSLTGSGQMLGLLEFDGYYSNDIASYESQAGLTNVPLQNTLLNNVSGVPGYSGISGAVDEVSLDIEMAISMAPGLAKVVVFEGGEPITVLNAMVASNGVKSLSSSWGWGGGPSTTMDSIFQEMAAQGQSFFNAAGDDDAFTIGANSANGVDNPSLDNAPSSSPYIMQVGGTTLTTTGPGGAWSSETVWNWGGGTGTSGGVSSYYTIPTWQTNVSMANNGGSTVYRNIPDVALTADNVYVIYDNGSSGDFGGTSCAAPLWAAFTALANQQAALSGKPSVGFINPAVYAIGASAGYSTDFHDITTGNNTWSDSPANYYAVAGYDLCTGWGTPNGQNLINAFAPSGALGITPLSGFAASGQIGGPFSGGTETFTLTNSSGTSLTWSLINPAAWLSFSATGGVLAGGGQANVTASLNSAADSLAVGNYSANVWFTNQTSGVAQPCQFTLQVLPPLTVLPAGGFASSGLAGGPFSPTSQNFVVTNTSSSLVNWSVINNSLWLNVSPGGGTLSADGQAPLTATLTSAANTLSAGTYPANVMITNQSGASVALPFTLQVLPLIQNGSFGTGDFSGWTLNGDTVVNNELINFVTNYLAYNIGTRHHPTNIVITPYPASYFAALGESNQQAYLSQNVPTYPGQPYLLSLWMDSPDGETPNEFSVSWNGGTLFDRANLPELGWTNLQFLVTATSSSTVLQIGARDDFSYLELDGVSLMPIAAAGLRVTALPTANNSFQFSWNTTTGLVYQLQYTTNLLATNWLILGKPITANGSPLTVTVTNTPGSPPQQFYRYEILY